MELLGAKIFISLAFTLKRLKYTYLTNLNLDLMVNKKKFVLLYSFFFRLKCDVLNILLLCV